MKILFVTPQLPWPPNQGTALRNFHLIRAAATAHQVDLLSFDPAGTAARFAESPVGEVCGRVQTIPAPRRTSGARLRDLALGWADMERRLWSRAFADRLHAMLAEDEYDAVQLEGFEVAGYLLGAGALRAEQAGRAPWLARSAPKLIFDDHNAEYELQASAARLDSRLPRRWPRAVYSAVQARRLRAREALYAAAADLCLAVSDEDAAALEAVAPGVSPTVVPNGVSCASFPAPRPAAVPTIFFAGKLDYRPNVDACEWLVQDILPRVRARFPDVRVVLAGRDPSPAVQRLAASRVEVTGELSETALTERRGAAWVYVVPMRMGSGVRFKALEAMASGVPLVATPLGAAGSGATHGEQALIAATAADFSSAVTTLLADADLRSRLGCAGRALAEARHDWGRITPMLVDAYERLLRPQVTPVSLVSTVLNEAASVPLLMASVGNQSAAPAEVVLVDGGSRDGTPERVRETEAALPSSTSLRLIDAPGANIARGRNVAIEAAAHDVIAVTDSGVTLPRDWLALLASALDGNRAEAASGFFIPAPESLWEMALGAATLPDVDEIDPARFLPSSRSLALKRASWQRAGGYPEWLDYCEDLVFDLGLRRTDARLRFVPRAAVRFRPRPSPRAFFLQYYRYARGDGKADLWRRRHAIRYGTYLTAACLLSNVFRDRGRWLSLAFLLGGGIAYLWRPLIRLERQASSWRSFVAAATLVPVARLVGDAAKMAGYPEGVLWRLKRRSESGAPPSLS